MTSTQTTGCSTAPRRALLAAAVLGASLLAAPAYADKTKANNADPLNLGSSWIGDLPPGPLDWVVFDSSLVSHSVFSVGTPVSWYGLRVSNPAASLAFLGSTLNLGAGGIDMSTASVDLTMGTPVSLTANQSWNTRTALTLNALADLGGMQLVNSGAGVTNLPAGVVNGTLQQSGLGTLVLGGSSAYSTLTITQGNVHVGGAGALSPTGVLVLTSGQLDLRGHAASTGTLSGAGTITNGVGALGTLAVNQAANTTFSGKILDGAGPVSLIKAGANTTLTLTGASTYSGGLQVAEGYVQANTAGSLGAGSIIVSSTGANNSRLQLAGGMTVVHNIAQNATRAGPQRGAVEYRGGSGQLVLTGTLTLGPDPIVSGGDLAGGTSAVNSMRLTGRIVAPDNRQVVVAGGYTVFAATGSSYTGIQFQQGTHYLGAPNGLSTTAVVELGTSGATTFDLAGYSQTMVGLTTSPGSNSRTLTNSSGFYSTAIFKPAAGSTYTFGGGGGSSTISGFIHVLVDGASDGVQAFNTTSSSYTGVTTLTRGVLSVNHMANGLATSAMGASSSSAANLVFDGGTLRFTGTSSSSNRGFTINPGKVATFDIPSAGSTLTLTGTNVASNGGLRKTGSGVLVFTGGQPHNGGTSVDGGILKINGTLSGTGQTILFNDGGLGGTGTVTGPVVLDGGSINLVDNAFGTLTLANGLSVSTGETGRFRFDLGPAGAGDHLTITAGALDLGPAGASIFLNNAGLSPGQTYTLMTFTSPLAPTNVVIDPASTLGANAASLIVTANSIAVNVTGPSSPPVAYWTGAFGASWVSASGGSVNFNLTADGGANTSQLPGELTDVYFATTTPAAQNLTHTLGQNFSIRGLHVTAATTSAVSIGGTHSLTLGTGGITVEVGAGSLTIGAPVVLGAAQTWNNASSNPVTVSGIISGGSGLALVGNFNLGGANIYTGGTAITAGTLTLGNALGLGAATNPLTLGPGGRIRLNGASATVGALAGNATAVIENASSSGATLLVVSNSTNNFAGTIQNGGAGATHLYLGGGSLSLGGANTYTGATTVHSGHLTLTGSLTPKTSAGVETPGGIVTVGDAAGVNAVLTLAGGTLKASRNVGPSLQIANGTGSLGAVRINGGTLTTASDLLIGQGSGYGALSLASGAVTVAGSTQVGVDGAGALTIRGGAYTHTASSVTVAKNAAANGVLTVSAGSLVAPNTANSNGGIHVGEAGSGVVNISGTGVVQAFNGPSGGLRFGGAGAIVNLNGGTLAIDRMSRYGTNTAAFNFNGGRLVASGSASNFMPATLNAYLWPGHANIDDAGHAITLASPLLAPAGNGIAAIAVSGGAGYIDAPVVRITGGGGSGATAIALIDAGGNLTGIQITSPGVGYTTPPVVSLLGGGGSGTTVGVVTQSPNAGGGFNKYGTGTVTLTGASNYRGATSVLGGSLVFSSSTANSAHAVGAISGPGRAHVAAGAVLTSDGVTAGAWQIDGTHVVRGGTGDAGVSRVSAAGFGMAGATDGWTGKLDLVDNALVLTAASAAEQASVIAQVQNQVTAGKAGGAWTGNGITSSTMTSSSFAAGNTLIIADAGDYAFTSFRGQTGLDENTTLVLTAHYGDATLDGKVDAFDLNRLAANWQSSGKSWANGDFTADGKVDAFDLNALAANWQFGVAGSLESALANFPAFADGAAAVPEPASLAVLALGGAALLARRRRR